MTARFLFRAIAPLLALAATFPLLLAAEPASSPPPPNLGVIVVVDGLPWDRLAAAAPVLRSGLRRLLDEGRVERSCRYRHFGTETGPGHASLAVGAPPRVTGIVGNDWYEKGADGKQWHVKCAEAPPGPGGGRGGTKGPFHLKVPTLGDRLVEQRPGGRVVSVSGKDRAAILLAGRDPRHIVYWLDPDSGRFVSSPAYDAAAPGAARAASIVASFNGAPAGRRLEERYGSLWKKLDAPASATWRPVFPSRAAIAPHQIPDAGLGFDHDLSKAPPGYVGALITSPYLDEAVTDLALELLADASLAIGRGPVLDLLCVSYSAHDYVAHAYGPESEESLDVLRRLDVQIGRLLEAFDRLLPRGSVALALSADHGMFPIPEVERQRDRSFKGRRLLGWKSGGTVATFGEWMNRLLDSELCLDPQARPVRGMSGWGVYYDRDALPLVTVAGACGSAGRAVAASDLDAALPRVVARFFPEEIEETLLMSRERDWPVSDAAVPFVREGLDPARSADAFFVPRYGVILHWDPARGAGHGSHREPDIHVPLIYWGAGIPPGASDADTTPYDLAPTLARILGVTLPDATGRPLVP